jgi:hypothetical protein
MLSLCAFLKTTTFCQERGATDLKLEGKRDSTRNYAKELEYDMKIEKKGECEYLLPELGKLVHYVLNMGSWLLLRLRLFA